MAKIIDFQKKREELLEEKRELEMMKTIEELSIDIQYGKYIDWRGEDDPTALVDFIEKMAVWYEMRYPESELNKILPFYSETDENVSRDIFSDNAYLHKILGKNDRLNRLNWSDFYNYDVFYSTLSEYEKSFLEEVECPPIAYFDTLKTRSHIFMDKLGNITKAVRVDEYTDGLIPNEELIGLNIREVGTFFSLKGLELDEYSEINEIIYAVDNTKNGLLKSVMYRLIDRGRDFAGPRRALLFAIEFKTDLELPMIYGMNSFDPYLRQFINTYLDVGGDIECIDDYFYNEFYPENWRLIPLRDVLKNSTHDKDSKYSDEETLLHEILASDIKRLSIKKGGC